MEARSADALPAGEGWWFEPKWDGFRCLAFRAGKSLRLQAKSGRDLTRFFPEVGAVMSTLPASCFTVDGELVIQAEGRFSFEALQMRLHPAQSRVRRLAGETPATLIVFDMLRSTDGRDLRAAPLAERRLVLEDFATAAGLTVSPGTDDRGLAQSWLDGGLLEGVVAKRLDLAYLEGRRAMVKVKRARTADCVVGGFRYASGQEIVGSLLLGLYDDEGRLDHVGFAAGLAGVDKRALTHRLKGLSGGPGFTGSKPGGPSRWQSERSTQWTPLRPELVVEVAFDHVSAGRFRHGTRLIRLRPDKAPEQCRVDQIQ